MALAVISPVVAAIAWGPKFGALLIALVFCATGLWSMRFGGAITAALNKDYARLPLKFQYPSWWHRFIGWLFVGFGLLTAIVGLVLAGRA